MTIHLPIKMTSAANVFRYLLGGRASVTLISNKNTKQAHFSYDVFRHNKRENVFIVYARTNKGYTLIGIIDKNTNMFYHTKRSLPKSYTIVKAFVWTWRHVINNSYPAHLLIYHHGTCARCGRKLTHPKSIEIGIGPECIKHFKT